MQHTLIHSFYDLAVGKTPLADLCSFVDVLMILNMVEVEYFGEVTHGPQSQGNAHFLTS
jgi:hypothetical protein